MPFPSPFRHTPRLFRQNVFSFRFFRTVAYLSAKLFCLGHVFSEYVGIYSYTWGPSMLPTLAAQGDSVCVSSRYRHGRGVKAGDLVSFRHPCVPGTLAIKRVVGMPGDFVMRDVVDGQGSGREMMLQVPEGHCWVLGDNLTESRDSRTYGPLPLGLIKGKVIAKNILAPGFQWIDNGLKRLGASN
ncbi:MAG: hypothetical protein LQ338_003267 [Usnochroma carphineum]|nr:MAG: hypothetical protein LQ338_003267 [Usnochroma carphineum]